VSPARPLVIASKNRGKIREIREIYSDLPVEVREVEGLPDVVEDGSSFSENARKKAVEIARHTGCWALADDSGLEVDALGGAPGIHSARWSGAGDEANNDKLLRELAEVPDSRRTARYRAVVAVADPEGRIRAEAAGACEGRIGYERRGTGGFGYDPLFIVPAHGCTMAELSAAQKHALSHRGQALRALRGPLTRALGGLP
jgi:XTP/dITP diphosphohydrolase